MKNKWLPLKDRKDFEKLPKDKDFLCKFDDGTICNYYEKLPYAIMTHWKEL